jgi:hypothetical protein
MPVFLLKLDNIEYVGKEEVFDLGIFTTHTLTVNGVAANNCIPSRMTMSYPMELLATKHGALKGLQINAGAFQPFNLNEYRQTLNE